MRVGIVAWEYPPKHSGGLGIHLEGLINELKHKAEIIVFMPEQNAPKNIEGVELVKIKSSERDMDFVDEVNDRIVDLVEKEKLDIFHCQDWVSFRSAIKISEKKICPVVCSIHSTVNDRSGRMVSRKNPLFILERNGLHSSTSIITVSDYMKQQLVNVFKISPAKIFVIQNGIKHKEVKTQNTGEEGVLFVGRVTEQKGLEYLVYALRDSKEKLTVLGDGHLEQSVKTFAKLLGVNADFMGFVRDKNKIFSQLSKSKIFVMPSVSEPFGIVALESMAAKKPMIISKYSGIADFLVNDKHCIIVDPFKPEEISSAIKKLDDKKLREHLVENSYTLLESGIFSWELIAERTIEVYKSSLNSFFSEAPITSIS